MRTVMIQKEDGNRVVLNRGSENQNLPGNAYRPVKSILDQINNVNPSAEIFSEAGEETKLSLKDGEAFMKWFGGSRVVDKNGNPMDVYHTTDDEFNASDRRKLGSFTSGNTDWQPAVSSAQIGFWFSDRDLSADIVADVNKTKAVYL
ncbi:MAG: hypothetical protein PUK86_00640, partial [bacterium]|nr:hypothetical protein [bacterium]